MFRRLRAILSVLLTLAFLPCGLAEEAEILELPEFELVPEWTGEPETKSEAAYAADTEIAAPAEAGEGACGHLNAAYEVTGTRYYKYNDRQHRKGAWVSEKMHCPDCGRDVTAEDLDAQALYDEAAPLAKQAGEALELASQADFTTEAEMEAYSLMKGLYYAYLRGPEAYVNWVTEASRELLERGELEPHSFGLDGVCACGVKIADVARMISGNDKLTVNLGDTVQIGLKGASPKGWKAKNGKIVALSKDGRITGKKEGKTTVTITLTNKKKWKLAVTVVDPYKPTKIGINGLNPLGLKVGEQARLTTWMKPASARTTYTWKSSNKKVATVDQYGIVTAKKKGSATITVKTANGKKASLKVIVGK